MQLMHERNILNFSVHEVVGENSGMTQEMLNKLYPWDPKKVP